MTQASLLNPAHPSPSQASRLVRFLAELLDADAQLSHQRFIERLGQSFDLADSIRISAVHEKRFAATGAEPDAPEDTIKDDYQRARSAIVNSAVQSFAPEASAMGTRFPEARAGKSIEEIMEVEPYLNFYIAQQRNVDFRIRDLHTSTRKALAERSPKLARLAALDAVLAEPLSVPARRSFMVVPRLLRQRFTALRDEHHRAAPDPANARQCWEQTLQQFRREMQGLLLAEIETRLLPTQGLIDALDELEEHDNY
ncbi:MAG: DUF3348 family protein [Halioglobus sp.]|nr:DUF3348 family protein [Halioglobus sp.]